jgi:UDP-N-acetylglucosamine 2-epimerase
LSWRHRRCSSATAAPFSRSSTTGFRSRARVHGARGREPRHLGEVTGIGLSELATVFDNIEPDAVVTDRRPYETLATAVAASYMNIPLVHVQGGEVTGSIDEKVATR